MMRRALLLPIILSASTFYLSAVAQDLKALKASVVRTENSKRNEVGTGFVIKIDGSNLYIVTAAHVVKGDQRPNVYFFAQPHDALSAIVLDREEDDSKGLALLLLKVRDQPFSGVTALKLGNTAELGNGESVRVIGFPDGTSFWTVETGNIKRLQGRDLILSGVIREGESGGPVILNQEVIGLVTDIGQGDAYATRAEIIIPYVNGIVKNLINPSKSDSNSSSTTTAPPISESTALMRALQNSKWLEHDVTINGEKVYLEFESNGRVRTRTSSDSSGFVAANETWYVNAGILYVRLLDSVTNKVIAERSGTLIGDRIEGEDKNPVTGSSTKWLLTKVQ